jgi:hypothetical protein
MKLTRQALLIAFTMLALIGSAAAQNLRSERDPRNTAPTVGTGGSMGGPTGLFTVYDGQTLRKGEFTFSVAYSNYDRDPGNADFNEIPVSFQYGLNDRLEFFFNTDLFRRVRAYSPANLSGFYLPNSRLRSGLTLTSPGAMILAPQGPGTSQYPGWAIFRPVNTAPWAQYPYVGASTGNFGAPTTGISALFTGPFFGFAAGTVPTIGTPVAGSGAAAMFPGLGSIYGGILPGIVLQTVNLTSTAGVFSGTAPSVFTLAPSYLPDAPFLNREKEGVSALSTFTAGGKWRWTNPSKPVGVGMIAYYRWYADTAEGTIGGFNQLQRGASPGGNKGDVGVIFFADARVRKWLNISANIGMHHNASAKMEYGNNTYTMLDRPDELIAAIGIDMPINKYVQPIFEIRSNQYVGGRTPNAFENSPIDGLAGLRVFPVRNVSLGVAYRYHFNQQDMDSFEIANRTSVVVAGRVGSTNSTYNGIPPGFNTSFNPHGFIVQATVGARNKRQGPVLNQPANVEAVSLSTREIVLPCAPNQKPRSGESCPDVKSISVGTRAVDAENDVLTYNYTVSGGRIVGQGANVTWDVSGLRPGTYTITAGVDDGCGICGKTVTETIVVRDCACEPICACPSLDVTGGGIVKPGETMRFTAVVTGGTASVATYSWSVSQGKIASGQGSPSILVDTTGLVNTNVVATVKISEPCPGQNCQTTASETGSVAGIPTADLIDELVGPLKADDIKARIDAFMIELQRRDLRTNSGYIINNGTPKDVAAREKLINDYLKFRKYDTSRVTMVRGGVKSGPIVTKLFVVPEGAEKPTN